MARVQIVSCDTCVDGPDGVMVDGELPDGWESVGSYDEQLISCPLCQKRQAEEEKEMRAEYEAEKYNSAEPEESEIDWRDRADYYRDLAKDGML